MFALTGIWLRLLAALSSLTHCNSNNNNVTAVWISWAHITTVDPHIVTYLFKFVFTSRFPFSMSRIYVNKINTWHAAAGLHFTSRLWDCNHSLNQRISISVFKNTTYETDIVVQQQKQFVLMMSCLNWQMQQLPNNLKLPLAWFFLAFFFSSLFYNTSSSYRATPYIIDLKACFWAPDQ